jgi:Bacterial Ig-like domain (group 3)
VCSSLLPASFLACFPCLTHSITATYSGDSNDNAAISSTLSYVVSKATPAITLISSLNPSTYGTAVTFTATLPSSATGTVTFKDGTTTLDTATLTRGQTTYKTSTLAKGTHSITAVYSGDPNYNTATSKVLSQKVD